MLQSGLIRRKLHWTGQFVRLWSTFYNVVQLDCRKTRCLLGPECLDSSSNNEHRPAWLRCGLFSVTWHLILVPVLPFLTHLFLHPSLLPFLIDHCVHLAYITPSVFHSQLKTYLLHKFYPRSFTFSSTRTAFTDFWLDRFFLATRFLCYFFLIFRFWSVREIKLASCQLLSAR